MSSTWFEILSAAPHGFCGLVHISDLVVLERDLNEIDPHEIMNVPVLLTMLNGRATFVSEAFADKF